MVSVEVSPDTAVNCQKASERWDRLCYASGGCVLLSSKHRNYNLNKHQLTPQAVHAGWR